MGITEVVLAINTAGTLAVGSITFFIVFTTFRDLEDERIQEFSKRFLMAIAVLLLYVSYLMVYNSFFRGSTIARYPLYLILVGSFIYMAYAALGFEKVADKYGMSEDSKIEKMEKEEMG